MCQVESIVMYHWMYKKKSISHSDKQFLSIYSKYLMHNIIVLCVEDGSFISVVWFTQELSNIYDNFWFYIQYSLHTVLIPKVYFPMIRHYVIHSPLDDTPLYDTPKDIINKQKYSGIAQYYSVSCKNVYFFPTLLVKLVFYLSEID